MSNSYFRFKEFTIEQDKCAMKVCTDSCLFGAWTANWLYEERKEVKNVLDIGSGTGLLSLMLAQKLPAITIDAVEIESQCYEQAKNNILHSPWNEKIYLHNTDIREFSQQKKFDVIISNPPFYETDLKSSNYQKNLAHHNAALSLTDFAVAIKKHLTEKGCFSVILPYQRLTEFEKIANEMGFFAIKKSFVKQTNNHSVFRVMCIFSGKNNIISEEEIVIKKDDHSYSDKFISLLKDYYLYL